jgi:hypothetical protein
MQSKRSILILSLALVTLFVWRHLSPAANGKTPAKPLAPAVFPAAQFHSPEAAHPDLKARAKTDPDEALTKCWEKLHAQHQTGSLHARLRSVLDPVVGTWYYSTEKEDLPFLRDEPSASGKFFLALEKANLLNGMTGDGDDGRALELLEEAARLDPENAAPYFFGAIIAERNGDHVKAVELADQAETAARFDSYLTSFTRALFSEVRTPSDLMDAYGIWGRAPIPDYGELRKFLVKFQRPHAAQQMAVAALKNPGPLMDIDWNGIEYAIAKSVLDTLGEGSGYPAYRDLLRERQAADALNASKVFEELEKTCDESSLIPYVRWLQDHLDKDRGVASGR